jgi:uncharacterized protein YcbK (DUF882 family)
MGVMPSSKRPFSKSKSGFPVVRAVGSVTVNFQKKSILFSLVAFTLILVSTLLPARGTNQEERKLSFYNTHTNEHINVIYKKGADYKPQALEKINHIFRDHRADKVHPIDPVLLDYLYDLLTKIGYHGQVQIISGYRSPETNKKLRKKSSGVAAGSLHMQGKALDFRLPGVDTKVLRDTALSMKRGGVGYYKKLDFIQIDTGRVRFW